MSDSPPPGAFTIEDLQEGRAFSFTVTLSEDDINGFAAITGDNCPLHMDDAFARTRGFSKRVVHGMLLGGYVSRLVGVYCPGTNALLQSVKLKFISPTYVGDTVRVTAVVHHVSAAANVILMRVTVDDIVSGAVHMTGEAQVGFTSSGDRS